MDDTDLGPTWGRILLGLVIGGGCLLGAGYMLTESGGITVVALFVMLLGFVGLAAALGQLRERRRRDMSLVPFVE